MRVSLDDDRCRGHGFCVGLCPTVFDLSDAGYAAVLVDTVPPEERDRVLTAADRCPEGAITVEG